MMASTDSTYSAPPAVLTVPRPFYWFFSQFPAVCFTLTLLTDIAYWQTSYLMWQEFSEWLLFAGLVFGGLAIVVGLVELLVRSNRRLVKPGWLAIVGYVLVLVLAFFNSLIHAADGWTGVVPYGLIVSIATVFVMVLTAWFDRSSVSRQRVGVSRYA